MRSSALALEYLRLPEVVSSTASSLLPSELADHAFSHAQKFSRFYAACQVLAEPDPAVLRSPLALCGLAGT